MRELSTHQALPAIIATGSRIALGPMRRELLSLYQRWGNDFRVTRTMRLAAPSTAEQLAADYEAAVRDDRSVSFTIYDRANWQPIGNTAWIDLDWHARTAEFVIYIGEADYRGRGFGTEAARLMLDYAFTTLGLHNVMLRVYGFNLAGRRAYERAGFREFGRRRQAKVLGGTFWDVIYMECLATEFAPEKIQHAKPVPDTTGSDLATESGRAAQSESAGG